MADGERESRRVDASGTLLFFAMNFPAFRIGLSTIAPTALAYAGDPCRTTAAVTHKNRTAAVYLVAINSVACRKKRPGTLSCSWPFLCVFGGVVSWLSPRGAASAPLTITGNSRLGARTSVRSGYRCWRRADRGGLPRRSCRFRGPGCDPPSARSIDGAR